MDIRARIRQEQSLTKSEIEAADYILKHPEQVLHLKITEFSDILNISKSSIIRFCQSIGLSGWKELKIELSSSLSDEKARATSSSNANLPFDQEDAPEMIAHKLKDLYQHSLSETLLSLDISQLNTTLKILQKAETIYVVTAYHNISLAQNFADKLLAIGFKVQVPASAQTQRFTMNISTPEDAVLFISYSGDYRNLEELIEIGEQRKTKMLLITGSRDNRFEESVHSILRVNGSESRFKRIAQFSSDLEVLFMLDIVYASLFNLTRERSEEIMRMNLLKQPPEQSY